MRTLLLLALYGGSLTAGHLGGKKRLMKINANAIGYTVQDEPNGLTHIHFIASS